MPDEELEARVSDAAARSRSFDESPLDARMLDLDDEAESPFLRGQKRVPVRRGALPRKAAGRLKIALILTLVVGERCSDRGLRSINTPRGPGASESIPATTSKCRAAAMSAARR